MNTQIIDAVRAIRQIRAFAAKLKRTPTSALLFAKTIARAPRTETAHNGSNKFETCRAFGKKIVSA